MDLSLHSPVRYLPGVGPVMQTRMEKLGIKSIEDLLYYAPFRYDDYSLSSEIGSIQPGEVVTIGGTVIWIRNLITKKGKKMQQAQVSDGSGSVMAVWFNQPFLTNVIRKGVPVRLSGSVSWFGRQIALISPSYEIPVNGSAPQKHLHTGRLVPVYPETEGVSSKWLRSKISYALDHFLNEVTDPVPVSFCTEFGLISLQEALRQIHFPDDENTMKSAQNRLAFDEMFILQLHAQFIKREWITHERAFVINTNKSDISEFKSALPFILTQDQEKAIDEFCLDLQRPFPSNRLLEGDVGAGKTVVAAAGMYAAYRNGFRSLLMAPTEILATQHYNTVSDLLAPHGITVGLITGSHKDVTKNDFDSENQVQLFTGGKTEFDILIGTHALLSQNYGNGKVGLVVIDEQQRFGVRQRKVLRAKNPTGETPHLLTMTATPIPRTIALTIFQNLDVSALYTMPKGRKKVKTWVVGKDKRDNAYLWIINHVKNDRGQVFILCPLIDESDTLVNAKAATTEYKTLRTGPLKALSLGLLHGRMSSDEKRKILQLFRDKKIDVLVSTPVIEVGIDIPGATVMMIEAADRFGLGQLHQLRGRVGRSDKDSYCFLFTESEDERVYNRLKALETTHSGPKLAELDLELRGPGEVFGTRQHGIPGLRFSDFSDREQITRTQEAARRMLEIDPDLSGHPLLRDKLKKATIGESTQD